MPPRIIPNSSTASSALTQFTSHSSFSSNNTTPRCLLALAKQQQQPCQERWSAASFSTTASRPRFSKNRRIFRQWINGPGTMYRRHRSPGETMYLQKEVAGRTSVHPDEKNMNKPFPMNPLYYSEPVLADGARELIWEKVMKNGESVKAVSAELGVDIRRVGAIIRLKEVEKDWIAKGKRLAKPYAKAIMSMLPTRSIQPGLQNKPFEDINQLHAHPYANQQIWYPTSESRSFTREDAAKALHPTLKSADERVPHPELIQMERELLQGRPPKDAAERFKEAVMESERKAAEKALAKAALEEKYTSHVHTKRFEFRFRQFNAENVGPTGRLRSAVGAKYGVPAYDRVKGQVKIPTSVP
ncbi:eukaryotic mitochondrial regulator protein-domain-containing protein [Whalleya microplaca]|nr:eukaryotic mitochondrial regulator protein-domain-containing protein [Whalleya microplaca]